MKTASLLFLLAGLILATGCKSYTARIELGQNAAEFRRFFVRSNLNDNHALDQHLAAALAARDRTVERGPLTMQPSDTQVIVTYEDRWAWDFGEHMTYLHIAMREARSGRPVGSATYRSRFKLGRDVPGIVDRMVEEILSRPTRASSP